MSAQDAGALLQVTDLRVEFTAGKSVTHAVRGISYALDRGETIGIVGESGSGKSAGVLALLRLLSPNARISSGQVTFGGADLLAMRARQLNEIRGSEIGMVYQDPLSALNPVLTIGRQITEVLEKHRGMSHKDAERRATELLDVVGIPGGRNRLRDYPGQLSGGMRQRVMIAMAISCGPKLLIADEPTTALDVTVQAQILELLNELKRELGMAMIIITHDLGIVAGVADRVMVMYAGRIVEEGPTDKVIDSPQMPYTLGLLGSVPRIDLPRQAALHPIPGAPPSLRALGMGCSFVPRCSFRIDRCTEEPPVLEQIAPGHSTECWIDVTTGRSRKNA